MLSSNVSNIIRKSIYARDNFRCALCDSQRGLQLHHVIKRSQGGADTPQNLITLCCYCHGVAHGTRYPERPDWMGAVEINQAAVEYLADLYAGDWNPWERE